MAILSKEELKGKFHSGNQLRSSYFIDLVDTLSQESALIHVGKSEPEDPYTTSIWLNSDKNVVYIFNGSEWLPISEQSGLSYNLPKTDGLPGQVLSTDGKGNVSWISIT